MYRRFLNNRDYSAIITENALNQLTRGDEGRFVQAEQAAEATMVDYLTENYEVEKELDRGKYICQYDRRVTYPVGSHFYLDGEVCEVIRAINGCKAPCATPYWSEWNGIVDAEELPRYSQMLNYQPGDMVAMNGKPYICGEANGYDFNDIRIPGVEAWEKVEASEWQPGEYRVWDVVSYDGSFFTLTGTEGYDSFADPMASDNWGMIGDYDSSLDTYELSDHEYVVADGVVYRPVTNPNADTPELGRNIRHHDPRNFNLKRHMTQLALYELHKLISPNNVSEVRVMDYNQSLQWLKDANRLKLNPQIPRKADIKGEPRTDWQMATFQTEYDPYRNPWHV